MTRSCIIIYGGKYYNIGSRQSYVFESFDRYMNNTDNLQEDYAYNDKRPMNVGHVAIEFYLIEYYYLFCK